LLYQVNTLEEDICKIVLEISAVDVILNEFAVGIVDEVCMGWGWGRVLQYGIQILIYSCLLRCRRNCIVREVAVWLDVVSSRIVYMISNGIRPESVEKIEGLSGR
jgi:hypothetical protein